MVCKLPLFDPGPNRAPWMRNQAPTRFPRAEPDFPRLSSLSALLACHLTVPVDLCELHSLLSIRWAEESGRVLGLHATPARFRPGQCPLVATPGFRSSPRSTPVAGDFFCSFRRACLLGSFRTPPDSSLSPYGPERFCGLADTTFCSLGPMSSGRVLGMHAPLPLAVRQNPRTPVSRPDPVVAPIAGPFA